METFSALLALCAGSSPVTGEFPTQRPVTRRFGVYFDVCLNKRLSKQWGGWWLETLSRPLWRHHNVNANPNESVYVFMTQFPNLQQWPLTFIVLLLTVVCGTRDLFPYFWIYKPRSLRSVQNTGAWYLRPRRIWTASGQVYLTHQPRHWVPCLSHTTQILICLIAYIFQISIPLWIRLWALYFRTITVSAAVAVCNQNEAVTNDKSPDIPCMGWSAAGWETRSHLCHRTDETDR